MTTIRRRRDMPEGVALFLAKTTGTIPTVAIPEKKHPAVSSSKCNTQSLGIGVF